jgi:hypothetical protein
MRPRRGWTMVALWAAAALSVGATPLAACDPVWLPMARPGERRMTPEQFVELYTALPTFELVERDARAAAERMRRWEDAHRGLAALAPAPTMLSNVYRRAEEE